MYYFNPRSPWGERLYDCSISDIKVPISIHALREESDPTDLSLIVVTLLISIHALREESDYNIFFCATIEFLISIHALREESDHDNKSIAKWLIEFQSTLSVRRATQDKKACLSCSFYFNPRSPWGERRSIIINQPCIGYFNPRSPWGERQSWLVALW